MVSVGDRIQSAIHHMDNGETELALSDVCIAVDITAQKYYGETKSSASCYKRFLKENMWMIIATGNAFNSDFQLLSEIALFTFPRLHNDF